MFDSCRPKNDFETKEQKIDSETNLPLWTVGLILRQEDAMRSEMVSVTIPSAKDYSETMNFFTPVKLKDLCVMTGDNNGNTWVSLRASELIPANGQAQAQARTEAK